MDAGFTYGDSSGEDSFTPMAFWDLLTQQSFPEEFSFSPISPPTSDETNLITAEGAKYAKYAIMLDAMLVDELLAFHAP
jgi:hypothetical protein